MFDKLTEDGDSLEIIGKKIEAIGKVNQDAINEIEQKIAERVLVTTEWKYSLNCKFDKFSNTKGRCPQKGFTAIPTKSFVSNRTDFWRWDDSSDDKKLAVPEGVFRGNIDYTLSTYKDVKRLNEDLLKHGRECCDVLSDKPVTRAGVRVTLRNLEIIQVAVGQLNELIIDANDEGTEVLEEVTQEAAKMFAKARKMFPEAKLSLFGSKSSDKIQRDALRGKKAMKDIQEVLESTFIGVPPPLPPPPPENPFSAESKRVRNEERRQARENYRLLSNIKGILAQYEARSRLDLLNNLS